MRDCNVNSGDSASAVGLGSSWGCWPDRNRVSDPVIRAVPDAGGRTWRRDDGRCHHDQRCPWHPGLTTVVPTTSGVPPPAREARYVVADGEVEPEAKQLAADIAYALTTYEESDDSTARLSSIAGAAGVDPLMEAAVPLTHVGRWYRGLVVYPQLGGLTDERVSVMVVIRQTVGFGLRTGVLRRSDPRHSPDPGRGRLGV